MQLPLGLRRGLLLGCVAAIGLVAFLVYRQWPRHSSVADAKAQAKRAERDFRLIASANNEVTQFLQAKGSSNSSAAQTVQRVGDSLVRWGYNRDAKAQIDVALAERGEHLHTVATNSVAKYDELSRAQEGLATLTLAGIEDARIRPPGEAMDAARSTLYELLTRSDVASAAVATLQTAQVCCVRTYDNPLAAHQIMSVLEAQGIRATIQGTTGLSCGVFIRREDTNRAQVFLNRPIRTNGPILK